MRILFCLCSELPTDIDLVFVVKVWWISKSLLLALTAKTVNNVLEEKSHGNSVKFAFLFSIIVRATKRKWFLK